MFLEVPLPPSTTRRWGFWSSAVDVNNSLEREQDACWLAGTAGVLGIAGNMVAISLIAVSAGCFTFIPSSTSRDLFRRGGGIIVSYLECSLLFFICLHSPGDWVWTCFQLPSLLFRYPFIPPSHPYLFSMAEFVSAALLINNSSSCFSVFCISFCSLYFLENILSPYTAPFFLLDFVWILWLISELSIPILGQNYAIYVYCRILLFLQET